MNQEPTTPASDATPCSRCVELGKDFRAALRVIANLEETIDRMKNPPAAKYIPRCTQCHHRNATESNGLCGICEYRNRPANAEDMRGGAALAAEFRAGYMIASVAGALVRASRVWCFRPGS